MGKTTFYFCIRKFNLNFFGQPVQLEIHVAEHTYLLVRVSQQGFFK